MRSVTGLTGGDRAKAGSFYALGQYGYFWTATEDGSDTKRAHNRHILLYSGAFENDYIDTKGAGFSIRCIKD